MKKYAWAFFLMFMSGILGGALGSWMTTKFGEKQRTTLEADFFILTDKQGMRRGSFRTNQNGQPLLTIYDGKGTPISVFKIENNGSITPGKPLPFSN